VRSVDADADAESDLSRRTSEVGVRNRTSGVGVGIGVGIRVGVLSTTGGSTAESRAALRVAVAWGYVEASEIDAGEAILDRIAGMLYRLGARRA
jgi:hypothetical protein